MRAAFLESLCQLALRARTPARAAVSSYAIVLETRKAARACLSSVVLQRGARQFGSSPAHKMPPQARPLSSRYPAPLRTTPSLDLLGVYKNKRAPGSLELA